MASNTANRFEANHLEMASLVENLVSEIPLAELVELLTDMVYSDLLHNVEANPNREPNPGNTYRITEGGITVAWRGLRLIQHLTKIYEQQSILDNHE